MAHTDKEKKELGKRLADARKAAGHTLDSAAQALKDEGHPIGRGAINAWENGRNLPDALWVKRLAKLYETTADSLIWDNSLSPAAFRVASEFDRLDAAKRDAWNAAWIGFLAGSSTNAETRDRKNDPRLKRHLRQARPPATQNDDKEIKKRP